MTPFKKPIFDKYRKPRTQSDEIIYCLLQRHTTTSLRMHIDPFWISNVPGAVATARNKGYAIKMTWVHKTNHFGRVIRYGVYELVDPQAAKKQYENDI